MICLQNHDQIGNRAMGDRLTTLAEAGACDAATALLLLSPFIPMLFMGEEWASTTPFLFFTDHNEDLAKLVREGRRAEFKHFAAFQDPSTRAADPRPERALHLRRLGARADRSRRSSTSSATCCTSRREHIMPGIPGCRSDGRRGHRRRRGAGDAGARHRASGLAIAINLGTRDCQSPTCPVGLTRCSPTPDAARRTQLPPGTIMVKLGA